MVCLPGRARNGPRHQLSLTLSPGPNRFSHSRLRMAVTKPIVPAIMEVMSEKGETEGARAEARLESLFRRHYGDVASYVRRRAEADLVDDVVAETFLVAWRRLDDLPADARPWLLGVARKTLATQRRSATRQRSLATRLEHAQSSSQADDSGSELGVAEALAELSEKDREAISLIAWEGLTANEAAAALGQSPVSFRVRLHRAKRRLRQRLETRARVESNALGLVANEIALTKGGLRK
jgi:RNA polymerase sigma factor (sigma-70 family)